MANGGSDNGCASCDPKALMNQRANNHKCAYQLTEKQKTKKNFNISQDIRWLLSQPISTQGAYAFKFFISVQDKPN